MNPRQRLDGIVMDIELLLISVVQGLALATLAQNALGVFENLEFRYWLYIASGFIFVLAYWSQIIIYALTFTRWPFNLVHTLLYYLTALVEFMLFNHIRDPQRWFLFSSIFMGVIAILYMYDLRLIGRERQGFNESQEKAKLFLHAFGRQKKELMIFVPLALGLNVVSYFLIKAAPALFLENSYHIYLIAAQALGSMFFFWNSVRQFKIRIQLINAAELKT